MRKSLVYFGLLAFILVGCGRGEVSSSSYQLPIIPVDVYSSNTEKGSVSGGGDYYPGSEVTLTATPSEGYAFNGWYYEGTALISKDNPYTYVISETKWSGSISIEGRFGTAYTISFVTNGGDPVPSITACYQDPIDLPTPTNGDMIFAGWFLDEELKERAYIYTMPRENLTLYASWGEMDTLFDNDSRIFMGTYPQSFVKEENTIKELSKLTTINTRGYYEYKGSEYAKLDVIEATDEYSETPWVKTVRFFKVEPILWRAAYRYDGTGNYSLYADRVLEIKAFDEPNQVDWDEDDGCSNNYEDSTIRNWLNGDFFNHAFNAEEKEAILTTKLDNRDATTGYYGNPYVCGDTEDKVFLKSFKDVAHASTNICKQTDYAWVLTRPIDRETGFPILFPGYRNTGDVGFWTRSPGYEDSRHALCTDNMGLIFSDSFRSVDAPYGVRPVMTLSGPNSDTPSA